MRETSADSNFLVGLATPYMTPYMNLDPLRLLHGPQTPYMNTRSSARIRFPGKAQAQGKLHNKLGRNAGHLNLILRKLV